MLGRLRFLLKFWHERWQRVGRPLALQNILTFGNGSDDVEWQPEAFEDGRVAEQLPVFDASTVSRTFTDVFTGTCER